MIAVQIQLNYNVIQQFIQITTPVLHSEVSNSNLGWGTGNPKVFLHSSYHVSDHTELTQ